MNTKLVPTILALVAGFITCIMSFVQHVDTVIFAKRFVIVCVIFFAIGMVAKILIDINFKSMAVEEAEEVSEEDGDEEEEEPEDIETAEEEEE